jgi:zinc transporter ZupT
MIFLKKTKQSTLFQKSEGHGHAHLSSALTADEEGTVNGLLAYIIFAALSIHSIFEGLALGLSTSPLTLYLAILLHKSLETLALGMSFL